jgi:Ca2+:H+ antiporter
MNATFGNAAELILAISALRAGKMQVVKASITGAIIGNLLLIVGLSMFVGGLRREKQNFNKTAALAGISLMYLALVAIAIPDFFALSVGPAAAAKIVQPLSIGIAVVMLLVYGASLLFTIRTHAHLYTDDHAVAEEGHGSVGKAVVILLVATVATAVVAEFLVHAIEDANKSFGLSETFIGLVVIATVGNAAEHSTAVVMAAKDRMNLAFTIAIESSKQIALFVAPVLVLLGAAIGQPMTLEFTHLEVIAIGVSVGAVTLTAQDGRSDWLNGLMLLAVYAILGVTFYFVP